MKRVSERGKEALAFTCSLVDRSLSASFPRCSSKRSSVSADIMLVSPVRLQTAVRLHQQQHTHTHTQWLIVSRRSANRKEPFASVGTNELACVSADAATA